MRKIGAGLIASGLLIAATAGRSEAFCGFYVSGADGKLFNNATHVVLMRDGTKTILSMQNNYQGPPQNFAMVVPVPVVLQKDNVKTLPNAVFEHIDTLSAPRLVEYWEEDPCMEEKMEREANRWRGARPVPKMVLREGAKPDLGVKIEAKFTVGEYDIVVLSAKDSGGLDTWLRQENYKIPEGAAPYLAPYVQAGSKFFVAKVDTAKVKFDKGMAQLSPLRFSYDAETFSLPVRLGLMNSAGTQDLIVNILSRGQRYEVANYPNAAIPTNMDVAETAKGQFGAFYAALFDKTLEKIPKAVVTEYAWQSTTCDPCPSPPLDGSEIAVLGNDILNAPDDGTYHGSGDSGFVLTRLHARYAKDSLGEDLVFRAAPALMGGREERNEKGQLETGAVVVSGGTNNFQGRYAVRHPWAGPITCKHPERGNWGGPPNGKDPTPQWTKDIAFAPRGKIQLGTFIKGKIPDPIALPGAVTPLGTPVVQVALLSQPDAGVPSATDGGVSSPPPNPPPAVQPDHHGCGCDVPGGGSGFGGMLAGVGLAFAALLRRTAKNRRRFDD